MSFYQTIRIPILFVQYTSYNATGHPEDQNGTRISLLVLSHLASRRASTWHRPSTGTTGSLSLAVKGMEELELDMKESVDPSEEMLDLCWGTTMFGEVVCWENGGWGARGNVIV